MFRLTRFTSPMVTLPRVALALTLIAAVACADRAATAPNHAATQRASSDIIPPTNPFDDLWVSPHREVVAGYSATGFVTMHTPAPPGGAHLKLRLAHATPFVSFDSNLVMPEGDTIQSFPVQTHPEPDNLGISLYADWGATWRVTGAFNLLSSPSIYVLPTSGSLTFGSQAVGTSSAAQVITVQNNGTVQLTLGVIAVSGPFTQTNNCPASLAPGQSCTIWVVYTPTGAGAQSGSVTIPSNAPNSPRVVILNGTGFVPTPGI